MSLLTKPAWIREKTLDLAASSGAVEFRFHIFPNSSCCKGVCFIEVEHSACSAVDANSKFFYPITLESQTTNWLRILNCFVKIVFNYLTVEK